MIDKGIGAHDVNAVVHYGMVLGAMAVIGISFTLVCQKMAALTSQGMGTDIRGALYQHINKLSYAELDRFGTPSLITRITNDVNQVQLAVALGVRMLIRWPFLAVGSMCAALAIDLKLGIIFLICTPAIGLVFWFVMARCIPYYKQLQAKLDRIALICREGLSGARVVRAFVREDHERERFAQAADDQANTAIAVGKLSSILNPVTFLVMNLGVCAILWVGGIQVNVGELAQGQVMAFVNYMTQTLSSIVYVANLVVVFTKASASASRINEVLNCVPSITDEGNQPVALPKPGVTGNAAPVSALSFDHASFSFGAGAANDDTLLQSIYLVLAELLCGGAVIIGKFVLPYIDLRLACQECSSSAEHCVTVLFAYHSELKQALTQLERIALCYTLNAVYLTQYNLIVNRSARFGGGIMPFRY